MISTTLANKILQYITAKSLSVVISDSSSAKCYLGFSSADPGSSGSAFTEPSSSTYPSYARIQLNVNISGDSVTDYTDMWGAVADKCVELAQEVTSPECLEESGWPEFSYFGIFNAATGGTLLAWDLLTDPDGEVDEDGNYPAKTLTVGYGEVAVFRSGSLKLSFK